MKPSSVSDAGTSLDNFQTHSQFIYYIFFGQENPSTFEICYMACALLRSQIFICFIYLFTYTLLNILISSYKSVILLVSYSLVDLILKIILPICRFVWMK